MEEKIEKTKRAKIPTGLRCNSRCRFCYYFPYINAKNPNTKEIKKLLKYAAERGIKDIDFSGGESTLRPDFPELISYSKKLGFRKICVITNGLRMGKKEYTKKLFDAGLNEVLFSVHDCNKKMHDYLTGIPGAFDKIMKAVEYSKQQEAIIRTNTTITSVNYKHLSDFGELFLKINPKAVNFILFNPFYSSTKQELEMTCSFSQAEPYIKKTIDKLDKKIKKITVRYIPFCFMEGYEKHVCDTLQTQYDSDEWLPRIQGKVEKNNELSYYLFNLLENPIHKIFPKQKLLNDFLDSISTRTFIKNYYTKPGRCKKCKFKKICEGLKKGYARVFGTGELKPIPGKVIKDPMYYRGSYSN